VSCRTALNWQSPFFTMFTVATLARTSAKRHSQAGHSREYSSFTEGSKSEHQSAAFNRHRVSSTMTKRSMVRTFFDTQRTIADGKISLNVSRRVVSPACIAGVLISLPSFNAL
jgi:hypothetical protein